LSKSFNVSLSFENYNNPLNLTRVVDIIIDSAKTRKTGKGKIFILSVEEVIRIRISGHGEDWLYNR
jgi:nitrogen regulatory protein PII